VVLRLRPVAFGLLALSLGALTSCNNSPPAAADLKGIWKLHEDSNFATSAELRLSGNETFVAIHMPTAMAEGVLRSKPTTFSGSGTWKLTRVDGEDRLQLEFKKLRTEPISTNPHPADIGLQLFIVGIQSDYKLQFVKGDPDEHDILEFERR